MSKNYGIGIDLGGTKILVGLIDLDTGGVISVVKKRTAGLSSSELLKLLDDMVQDAITKGDGTQPTSIGIGAAGQVDRAKGVLVAAPNLGVPPNFPLAASLTERFTIPTRLGNDVEVATVGELRFGSGKGVDNFVCVFVGTGIGGGIVQDGVIYGGATGTAGEIGHMVIALGGRLCGCGGRGHLEAYASRTAITRNILGELHRGKASVLRDQLDAETIAAGSTATSVAIRSGAIAKAVAANDKLVIKVLDESAEYLGQGLASLINLYNPTRIIMGGGLVEAVDPFFERVVEIAKNEALSVPAAKIEIVRTTLGDYSGIVGAAILGAGQPSSTPA